jgi:hypothetical protein
MRTCIAWQTCGNEAGLDGHQESQASFLQPPPAYNPNPNPNPWTLPSKVKSRDRVKVLRVGTPTCVAWQAWGHEAGLDGH